MPAVALNALRAELFEMENVFKSKSKVAGLLNVDRSSITKWDKGEVPDAVNQAKIAGLFFILKKLGARLDESTTKLWLLGTNAHLGYQRPVDLIKDNRIAEVLDAIEQMESGSYV